MTFIITQNSLQRQVSLHKNQRIVNFFFRKTYVFNICKNRLTEAILTNTQNVCFIKKNCSKVSVVHGLDGSISSSFITANSIFGKIFGNKQCRYNEGPLYCIQSIHDTSKSKFSSIY